MKLSPYDFGKKYLVEETQQVKINELVRKFGNRLKDKYLDLDINISNTQISLTLTKTSFNGQRVWFVCPMCNKRVGILYKHPLSDCVACRTCLNLDYRKHRYGGMIEEKPSL